MFVLLPILFKSNRSHLSTAAPGLLWKSSISVDRHEGAQGTNPLSPGLVLPHGSLQCPTPEHRGFNHLLPAGNDNDREKRQILLCLENCSSVKLKYLNRQESFVQETEH